MAQLLKPSFGPPPDLADIELIAREVYVTIPKVLRDRVSDVVIRVEEFPDDEVIEEMDLDTPFDLLGLYQGVSLDRQSTWDLPRTPDTIHLYRRPLLDYWCEVGETLDDVIRHVLIHEIGHHFGFSDEDMDAIDAMD